MAAIQAAADEEPELEEVVSNVFDPDLHTIPPIDQNKWWNPILEEGGWHPSSGTADERSKALRVLSLDLSMVEPGDMRRWYSESSPWHALNSPHR